MLLLTPKENMLTALPRSEASHISARAPPQTESGPAPPIPESSLKATISEKDDAREQAVLNTRR